MLPNSAKDILLFNKSKVFTLSLQLSTLKHITYPLGLERITIIFTWILGTICFLESRFFTKFSHNDLNTTDDNLVLTESFPYQPNYVMSM
jgi:hypothetical protein